jgi:hypothetical protein
MELNRIQERLRNIAQEVQSAKIRISKLLSENKIQIEQDAALCRSYVHTLRIFEVELFCAVKDWKHVLQVVQARSCSTRKAV